MKIRNALTKVIGRIITYIFNNKITIIVGEERRNPDNIWICQDNWIITFIMEIK